MRALIFHSQGRGSRWSKTPLIGLGLSLAAVGAFAQEPARAPAASPAGASSAAADLVREGNRLFLQGDVAAAVEKYQRALPQKPDSSELAFNLGLAHLKLGELDAARDELHQAALSSDRRLAADAAYALGLCDHAEALALSGTDSAKALERTQEAIRKYHDVLTSEAGHRGARDAWNKAAALWQQLHQQQPQQPQSRQRQQDPNQNGNDNQNQDDQQAESQDPSDQPQEGQAQDQPEDSGQPSNDNAQSDEPEPQESAAAAQQGNENDNQTPPAESRNGNDNESPERPEPEDPSADQTNRNDNASPEQDSTARAQPDQAQEQTLEQAERELRRIMDRQRLNEQRRRMRTPQRPTAPADGKDW